MNGSKFFFGKEKKSYFLEKLSFRLHAQHCLVGIPKLSDFPGQHSDLRGFGSYLPHPTHGKRKTFEEGVVQWFWLIIHISSSLTGWEWCQLLMLTLTFIAQAWEGLLTPNLRGQAQASGGVGGGGCKGAEGLTFNAQLTSHHLKLLSKVSTLPGIPLFENFRERL